MREPRHSDECSEEESWLLRVHALINAQIPRAPLKPCNVSYVGALRNDTILLILFHCGDILVSVSSVPLW